MIWTAILQAFNLLLYLLCITDFKSVAEKNPLFELLCAVTELDSHQTLFNLFSLVFVECHQDCCAELSLSSCILCGTFFTAKFRNIINKECTKTYTKKHHILPSLFTFLILYNYWIKAMNVMIIYSPIINLRQWQCYVMCCSSKTYNYYRDDEKCWWNFYKKERDSRKIRF